MIKKTLAPTVLLGSVLLLAGCASPYVSGTAGTRVGSGGYVGGAVGGAVGGYPYGSPYGYRDYSGGLRVHGYDRHGNPIYRTPDGRLVQGYDPYRNRGVGAVPGYGYPRGYQGYGYSGHGYPPRAQRPSLPPRLDNNSQPKPPPSVSPRPPRNSSPLGNVVREERRKRDESRERSRPDRQSARDRQHEL